MNAFAMARKMRLIVISALYLCTSVALARPADNASSSQQIDSFNAVSICGDPEPPPWLYWKRIVHGQPSKELTGFSLELIRAAFDKLGIRTQFIGDYPWKRCLSLVLAGKIDFAMGAYFDEERTKTFAYSIHYFSLTPQIYTLRAANLVFKNVGELKARRGCGMLGASYAYYDLKPEELDLSLGYASLINKLRAKRCDYFVEELEIMNAARVSGQAQFSDDEISHAMATGAKVPAKHLITAKQSKAAALLPVLNEALTHLIQSGEAERIWKKHAGDMPYKP
ncbi:MAG: transporter substrate-binding domain-containing protein [Burkholderiaceae bacterium]|nr:transporter substrate-binding domain-containing protein [Burkholderiaceae bacterium]